MEFHVIRTTDDAAVTALLRLAWDDLTQETGVLVKKQDTGITHFYKLSQTIITLQCSSNMTNYVVAFCQNFDSVFPHQRATFILLTTYFCA